MVKPGRYRHYKGKDYEVIGCATHSETEEELVVYQALYGKRGLWVRPVAMFLETVLVNGKPAPRFQRLKKTSNRIISVPNSIHEQKDVQKGRPARPQGVRRLRRTR